MVEMRVMDDQFFNEIEVRDAVGKLRALLRAVPIWEEAALREIAASELNQGEMSDARCRCT